MSSLSTSCNSVLSVVLSASVVNSLCMEKDSRWNENVNVPVFDADGVGLDAVVVAAETGAVLEGEGFFVERAGDFRFVALGADHATRERHLLFVRAEVVGGIPFVASLEVEHGDLAAFEQDAGPAVIGHVFDSACEVPGG